MLTLLAWQRLLQYLIFKATFLKHKTRNDNSLSYHIYSSCSVPLFSYMLPSCFFFKLFVLTVCYNNIWRRQWHPTPVLMPGKSHGWRSLGGCSHGVAKSQTQLSDFPFTFHFHALEKEMATHSSVLAWRIPGTGEPGGLPSMGSHRVGHNWSDLAAAAATSTCMYHIAYYHPSSHSWPPSSS